MRLTPPASSLLTPEQLAALRERSDAWGLWLVAHAWLVVVAAWATCAWLPHPLTYVLAIAVIGSRQLGLLILMHDGAHGMLTQSPRLNRVLTQWFCAYPMFADADVYRRYHLKHHARTQQEDDPDIALTGAYPISRASLVRKLLRDLVGITGYSQRKYQIAMALGPRDWPLARRLASFRAQLGRQLVVQLALFALLAASGHWAFYFLLWVLPALTWQQLVLRIRNIAEHAVVPDADDCFRNARTTLAGPLTRAFVAVYWVNYHVEHHLLMWVPCYRLPRLREFLFANGHGAKIETRSGYLDVLRHVTTPRPDDGRPQPRRDPKARAMGTFGAGFTASQA
ncbi:MAG: fatty acid desaturase family protein [Gammaproteobacteria bacterium]|nr:fatty acid desaturase family protein [Gammaproteobacteria bacterium]